MGLIKSFLENFGLFLLVFSVIGFVAVFNPYIAVALVIVFGLLKLFSSDHEA